MPSPSVAGVVALAPEPYGSASGDELPPGLEQEQRCQGQQHPVLQVGHGAHATAGVRQIGTYVRRLRSLASGEGEKGKKIPISG